MAADYQEYARSIQNRLEDEEGWENVIHGRTPNWYGVMLSSLIVATGYDPIVYATATTSFGLEERGPFTAEVLLFTEETVVHAAFDGLGDAVQAFNTTVIPRSSLKTFGVEAGSSIFDDTFGRRSWPGLLSASLEYPARTFKLPLGRSRRRDGNDELGTLIDQSRADLTAQ